MKTYNIKVKETDEVSLNITKTNDGFTPFELLGLIEWLRDDLIKQMGGMIKPDKVLRIAKTDKL